MIPEYLRNALAEALPYHAIREYNAAVVTDSGSLSVEMKHGTYHPWHFGKSYTAYKGTTHTMIGRSTPMSVYEQEKHCVGILGEDDGELIYLPAPLNFGVASVEDVMSLSDKFGDYTIRTTETDYKFAQLPEMDDIQTHSIPIAAWDKNRCLLRVVPLHKELLDIMHEDCIWAEGATMAEVAEARKLLEEYATLYLATFTEVICGFMKQKYESGELDEAFNNRVDNFVKHFINPEYKKYDDSLKTAVDSIKYREQQKRDLDTQIARYVEQQEKYEQKLSETTKEIDLTPQLTTIRNMPKVASVDINEEHIKVLFKDLDMRISGVRYRLPEKIETQFLYDGHIYTNNLTANSPIAPHPHIQNNEGTMCAGNAGEVFPDLFSEGRYDDVVDYMVVFLETADPTDTWGKNYQMYKFIDISGQDMGFLWEWQMAKVWNTFVKLELVPANYGGAIKVVKVAGVNFSSMTIPVPAETTNEEVISIMVKFMKHIGYTKYFREGMYAANEYIKDIYRKYSKFGTSGRLTYDSVYSGCSVNSIQAYNMPSYVSHLLRVDDTCEYIKEVID